MNRRLSLALLSGPILLSACVTAPVRDAEAVSARVASATGADTSWQRTQAEKAEAEARVAALLAAPIDEAAAIQIALASHPRVQAGFEQLGMARADYYDTVLPPNPALHFLRLEPEDGGSAALTYGAGIDLIGWLITPARRQAGIANYDAARARLTARVLALSGEARLALIDDVAAQQAADLVNQAADTASASAAAAQALYDAGNIAKIDLDREKLFAEELELLRMDAQAGLVPARERLVARLGLSAADAERLSTIRRLQLPPAEALDSADYESRALSASADLAIAAGALEAARAANGVSWLTSLVPSLRVEAERERNDGEWESGFGFDLGLPLFGLGGADRLRRESAARYGALVLEAIDLELKSETRSQIAQTEAARQIALARRERILPLSADVYDGVLLDFNAMQIGVFELLQAKRQRVDAGLASVEANANYWRAQARLDLLASGVRAAGSVEPANTMAAPAAPAGH